MDCSSCSWYEDCDTSVREMCQAPTPTQYVEIKSMLTDSDNDIVGWVSDRTRPAYSIIGGETSE